MIRIALILSIVFSSSHLFGQGNVWNDLSMVQKTKAYDPNYGMDIESLEAGIIALQHNNKEIELSGYIIPLTGKIEQSHFMFSRYPQNMCFFCGKAGPESAMQVFTARQKKLKFRPDKITLRGTLQVNHDEASGLLYTLQNAVIIEE